jgi:solute carrier family 25 folate transporter 32
MAYERLKILRSGSGDNAHLGAVSTCSGRELHNLDFLALSSLSKVFSGCITYPYQVVRSRLQTYDSHLFYRGAMDAVVRIWAQEGLVGFYKGLGPNLFRVLPSTWVTFLVYENMKGYLTKS